jgi:hypothetical protein
LELVLEELDLVRNSAPRELSREHAVRFPNTGAIAGRSPITSPPELVDNVIGVA